MEVWVRSQDKEILANVKSVRFCRMKKCDLKVEPNTMAEFIESADAYCVECNCEFFGEYPTKERCLEVIDEIQSLFGQTLLASISSDGIVENEYYQNTVVYEMPKE